MHHLSDIITTYQDQLVVLALVFARVLPLAILAPLPGQARVPRKFRLMAGLAVALLVASVYWNRVAPSQSSGPQLVLLFFGEVVVGLVLLFAVQTMTLGLRFAGQTIAQMSGLSLADVIGPTGEESEHGLCRLLGWVSAVAFILLGGQRQVVTALLDTYQAVPPGEARPSNAMFSSALNLLSEGFVMALRIAAPIIAALLITMLVLALISRTLPQLNVWAVGFGVNSFVALAVLCLTIGASTWIFHGHAESVIERIRDAVVPESETLPDVTP